MSCFGLRCNGKVWWCNLTSTIQSKLVKLRRARAVRWTVPRLARGGCKLRRRRQRLSSAPVYVDELYNQPKTMRVERVEMATTSHEGKGVEKSARDGCSTSTRSINTCTSSNTGINTGTNILSVVQGMGEVDLRAELFIRKFKEEMKLQSQRSLLEYQEMLARGI